METHAATRPATIILFGITGDLAAKKLLPALYNLYLEELVRADSRIVGVSRREVSVPSLIDTLRRGLQQESMASGGAVPDESVLSRLESTIQMQRMDLSDRTDYESLRRTLQDIDNEGGTCRDRIYYLSIPPQSYDEVIENLGLTGHADGCGHTQDTDGTATHGTARLLVEKPFGYDLASSEELISRTAAYFAEDKVFRIDHYAAKPEIDDLLAFRRLPAVAPMWNKSSIRSVTVTAYEEIGIEGRAAFYDHIGALRDIIQSHLLQILALSLMDLPAEGNSDDLHDNRLALLRSIQPLAAADIAECTVRSQYDGYRTEAGNDDSFTETYAAVTVRSEKPEWQDVPLIMRTGKSMSEKRTEIRFNLHEGQDLVLLIQPSMGLVIERSGNGVSHSRQADSLAAQLNGFVHAREHTGIRLEAYERVFLDALHGDHTRFTSSGEVLAAWRIVEAAVDAWQQNGDGLASYAQGSREVVH